MLKTKIPVIAISALALLQVGCSSTSEKNEKAALDRIGMGKAAPTNKFWWPDMLDLKPLRQNDTMSSPLGAKFDYAKEFNSLDLAAVKKDLEAVMVNSQEWWPADWGHYGPLFIRMAWHSAGTYRVTDGRGGSDGGQQRFEPLNSWPDNVSLDKARRLIWPVKQKYGDKISWSDLMVLAGTVAMENMGFKTIGFAGGRVDDWQADQVYWGPEKTWLAGDKRYSGNRKLEKPLAAVQMGLIYVNPEGPNGKADPLAAAKDIRETFGRMAMNDEETVALIAGGHTFGKAHGAKKASCVGAEPSAAGVEEQGLGWKNKCGTGKGADAVTSGLEGAWTTNPTKWTHEYLTWLYAFDWKQTKSPAGAIQWAPESDNADIVPDAHIKGKMNKPMMFTTDIALKMDPEYGKITKRFLENPAEFEQAFARAWFKLTHRDLGPTSRYLGKMAPKESFIWQDPTTASTKSNISAAQVAALKSQILKSGLTTSELVRTAWASASTYRKTDMRGGANGAHLRLAPQKDWAVNNPAETAKVLTKLSDIQKNFNKGGSKVSMADLIVLAGNAAIEKAAKEAGVTVSVPFKSGRADATQEQTDINSFAYLEPKADAFRNYFDASANSISPTEMLVERAYLLNLTVPEMTVLVGGMRTLNANYDQSKNGVFTTRPGTLSNDYFVNLLDMNTVWTKATTEGLYEGRDRKTNTVKWTATPVDLIFGSHSELRAVSESYGTKNANKKFVEDFVVAWNKVMNADRFDVK